MSEYVSALRANIKEALENGVILEEATASLRSIPLQRVELQDAREFLKLQGEVVEVLFMLDAEETRLKNVLLEKIESDTKSPP
jgi:hypothetical protein